jgi:Xaa-Pro dipeptidase
MRNPGALSRPAFDDAEYERRLAAVRQSMADRELDALLVSHPQNVYYLTGFRGFFYAGLALTLGQISAALVRHDGPPALFIRGLERNLAESYCWGGVDIRPYRDHEDSYEAIAGTLPAEASRLGVEFADITALQLDRMRAATGAEIADASMVVDLLRRVKSAAEIAYVREASRLANLGIETAIELAAPGIRISELVARVTTAMYEEGQDDVTLAAAYAYTGPTGGFMHETALDGIVEEGHVLNIGIDGISHAYTAECLASVYAGTPAAEMAEAYEVAVALHDAAREALRPGATGADVHANVDAVHRQSGRGPYRRRVGGAIGINGQPGLFFEGYSLMEGATEPLTEGVLMNIQPGVDDPAMLIVHSLNLMTATGYEELVPPHRELIAC